MAENVVEILVKSRDSSKAGFASAAAEAETQGSLVERIWAKHSDAINTKMASIGTGLGKGGGILAIGSAALAMAAPLGAAGVAMGAFGAIAIPVLKNTMTAATANTAAQKTYNTSIAAAKQAYNTQMASAVAAYNAATTATGRQAALNREHQASLTLSQAEAAATDKLHASTVKLTGPQQQLVGQVQQLNGLWKQFQTQMTPLVVSVASLGVSMAKDLLPAFGKLATAGGNALAALFKPLDAFFKSKAFDQIIAQFAKFATQAATLLGPALAQLIKLLLQLFVQLMPSGVSILKLFLPLLVQMVADLVPVITWVAKATAAILGWLTQTRLLKPILLGLVPVLILLSSSSGIGLIITAVALLVVGIVELSKNWRKIWADIKQWAADAWNFLTHGWGQLLLPGLTAIVKTVEFVRDHWRAAWNTVTSIASGARNTITSIFNGLRNTLTAVWNSIWSNTVSRVSNGISSVVSFFRGLPGKIVSALGNAGNTLLSWGKGVIQGLLNGMTNIIGSVWTFIKGIPGKILSFLGIKSPPQWAIDAGKHIMNGLGIGMSQAKDVMGKAVTASTSQFSAGNLVASVGSGVSRWRGLVLQALKMEGLPASLVGMILTQMQSESGGNPNAINLWDSNAKAGHPSKGLMQVIGPTFATYHWPGTSGNIYDPLANIAAALNYAAHNRGFGSGPGQVGSGHGYASGGPASGWNWVGEHGRELVRLPPGSQVYPHGTSESMAGAGGTQLIQLQIASGGQSQVEQFMLFMIRNLVRIKGGGDVQKAFGR